MRFSLTTWNINSVRLRFPLVKRFLQKHAPDVLCLQETKCPDDKFPRKDFEKIGYPHIAIYGQKGYHGVATISRHPIGETQREKFCKKEDCRHLAATFGKDTGLEEPVTIHVHEGRAVEIEGGAAADRLREIVATVRDADNIGEIGIGLNRAARIADEITEAKKAYGTVHLALGDSANEYGGTVECDVHLDGLVMSPTVAFDGRDVVVLQPVLQKKGSGSFLILSPLSKPT